MYLTKVVFKNVLDEGGRLRMYLTKMVFKNAYLHEGGV